MPELTVRDGAFEGKVAEIIDDYRIAINKGEADGVHVGQRFLILKVGEEIFDPDTGESLGSIEIVKGKGEVIHTQSRLATLQTTDKHEIERRLPGLLSFAQTLQITQEPKAFINPEIGDIARLLE